MTNANLTPLLEWLARYWLVTIAISVGLLLVLRYARPIVHRAVRRVLEAQASGPDAELHREEAEKRAATIEDLLVTVVRAIVVLTLLLVVLTALDLMPVLAGVAVIGAALTLAGQSIVLDYLMGVLILVEGQYYRGDMIAVNALEGTVEEVGLRRTVIRDASGTVHSISNGEIRISSNKTRIYASLLVDVMVDQATDVDRAAAVIDEAGRTMAEDPVWRDRILEQPRFVRITAMTEVGITLRVTGKVRAADRQAAPGEFRLRLLRAFAENGILLPRRERIVLPSTAVDPAPVPGQGPPPSSPGDATAD